MSPSKHISAELQEEYTHIPLEIEGEIPSWLSGSLIRNGPITVKVGQKRNEHWFDGLAMLHAFTFSQEGVSYTNKFLRTNAYSQVFQKGSLKYGGFAIDPCRSLFKKFFTFLIPRSKADLNNANVNVAKLANHYVALTETPLPVEFDPNTLETLGVLDFQDDLPKKRSWESAHPHFVEDENLNLNYCIQYGAQSHYIFYALNENTPSRKVIGKIPVQNPSYMHSFALTENYFILTEFPLTVKPLDLIVKGKAFIKNFTWKPERGTTFMVIHRHTGQVIGKYKTAPFFAFHHVNAFEKGEEIILDIVCYENPEIIDGLTTHFMDHSSDENRFPTQLKRFHLSLKNGSVHAEILFDPFIEFPKIHEKFDGKPYKFVYLTDPRQAVSREDLRPIYKFDTESKQVWQWSEKGCYPGESVFVPSPNGKREDEGILLNIVLNLENSSSFLLVLDATTLREMARAKVKHKIPVGLHGRYFP